MDTEKQMTTTDLEKSLRAMANVSEDGCSIRKNHILLAAADIVAKYSALGTGNQSYAEIANERDTLAAENAGLRNGLRSAWMAMDSDDAGRCDEWQNDWQHILSNAEMSCTDPKEKP